MLPLALSAALSLIVMYVQPWVEFVQEEAGLDPYVLHATGFFNKMGVELVDVAPVLPAGLLILLGAGFFLLTLFPSVGANRRRALLIGSMMISLLVLATSFITSQSFQAYVSKTNEYEINYQWPLILPFVVVIIGFLMLKRIERA